MLPLADLGELGSRGRIYHVAPSGLADRSTRHQAGHHGSLCLGEVGTLFVINVCHSIAGAVPSPGFHPEGMYEFKVDLDGDAVEEITYRIKFDERDACRPNLCGDRLIEQSI
jgi:hypothetical protein